MEIPTLSPDDRARLMLNLPTLANRWVDFAGIRYPIMHLGVGDLEQFRAAIAPIETLYMELEKADLPFIPFIRAYREEIHNLLVDRVPKAAAIVLGLTEDTVITSCCPLGAFSAVIAQWLHNQEIGALQGLFPSPDGEQEVELEGDPSASNPLSIVQKMASAYHWPEADILKMTVPKIYLMGNDAAWSYAKIKAEKPEQGKTLKKAPIIINGKKRENFKGMTPDEYRDYLAGIGMDVRDQGHVVSSRPIG